MAGSKMRLPIGDAAQAELCVWADTMGWRPRPIQMIKSSGSLRLSRFGSGPKIPTPSAISGNPGDSRGGEHLHSVDNVARFWSSEGGLRFLSRFPSPFVHAVMAAMVGAQHHLLIRLDLSARVQYDPVQVVLDVLRASFCTCTYLKMTEDTQPDALYYKRSDGRHVDNRGGEGPIFSSMFLCEGLEHAPVDTQLVVLEAMRMKAVCIRRGHRRDLPNDFTIVAVHSTQRGTSLPRDMRDRFVMELCINDGMMRYGELPVRLSLQ